MSEIIDKCVNNCIKVGMGELYALNHPGMLVIVGLGSCVGLGLYDIKKKIIGLAHVMLPSSLQEKSNSNKGKFADTATIKLLDEMIKLGASSNNIIAKLAGGAQMFSFSDSSDIMKIGERNISAAKKALGELKIEVVSEDTGGNYGRTIEFYSDDGTMIVKTFGSGIKMI